MLGSGLPEFITFGGCHYALLTGRRSLKLFRTQRCQVKAVREFSAAVVEAAVRELTIHMAFDLQDRVISRINANSFRVESSTTTTTGSHGEDGDEE